jgi:hypothetical protein
MRGVALQSDGSNLSLKSEYIQNRGMAYRSVGLENNRRCRRQSVSKAPVREDALHSEDSALPFLNALSPTEQILSISAFTISLL